MAVKNSQNKTTTTPPAPKPGAPKRRKDMPSVGHLLKHGDPETAHLPKTWCELIGYPFVLALTFAVSLLIFHHAPWDTLPARKMNSFGIKRLSMFERKRDHKSRVPHLNTNKLPKEGAATEL